MPIDHVDRLDPELAAVVQTMPAEGFLNWKDLQGTRATLGQMLAALTADLHHSPHVSKEDRTVHGPVGAPQVPGRIYRPLGGTGWLRAFADADAGSARPVGATGRTSPSSALPAKRSAAGERPTASRYPLPADRASGAGAGAFAYAGSHRMSGLPDERLVLTAIERSSNP